MKIFLLIARILLGLLFVIFGLNGFLNFIPMPPPTGLAAQFAGALFVSHYMYVVFALELIGGLLVLSNHFVPLALTLLGPVVVNILLFHLFLAPEGLVNAAVAVILWFSVFTGQRQAFSSLFADRTATQ